MAVAVAPFGHGVSSESRSKAYSFNRMYGIAVAIGAYSDAHHDNLPQKMSDLVPDYLDDPKYLLFCSRDSSPLGEVDLMTHRELIDLLSGYSFLRLEDHRLLVFERPGFWKNGKMIYCLLGNDREPVGFFPSSSVSPEEFVQRLGRGFHDVPRKGDGYQKTTSTGIDAYEYDLHIRVENLQSIHQAFQASGKLPITPNAARIKVQAAMDLLDPPGTWQVEESIRASDGSTPYYRFHCHRIQDGQKTDGSICSLVLLGGTVFSPTKTKRPPGL